MSMLPCLFCASPRTGNSLAAAGFFAEGVSSVLGGTPKLTLLAGKNILPCTACGACKGGVTCPQSLKDESLAIFKCFEAAPFLAIFSPIYFYSLPAQFKALIDRSQYYYEKMQQVGYEPPVKRPAYLVLCAAREQGEKLFEGTLLTLKYALAPLGFEVVESLCLRGLDGSDALATNESFGVEIKAMGARAASLFGEARG